MECVFCKIVAGLLPSRKIYEDEGALVFMDRAGDVDGHMLVIPKKHVETLWACDEETLALCLRAARKVAAHCVESAGYEGVNLLHASGRCAGQSAPHLHFHLLPRRANDGVDAWPSLPGAREDAAAVWERLKF